MSQDNGAHIEDGATTDASLASRAKNPKKNGPKWWLISLIAVIVAVAVVIGVTLAFGGKKDDKSASSSNQYADTVTIGLKLAPTNLDIRNTAGSALDQILIGNVYEGIVARDSKNQVAPAIASSWETSKDGLTYTFHLNKNMTFSNGDKLDAEDVAWSINELIAKGYHDADALAAVSKVEAKDADTAVITLKTPNSNLLWTLTGRAGLVFDKDAKYDLKTQAVGSGPYTVAKFVENSSITLKANEKYWGKNKAKTPTVVVKYLADDNAAVNALKSGDVQVLAPITENLAEPFKSDSAKYTVKAGNGTDKFVLGFNNASGSKLADKRIRQAIRYAINHKELIASRGGADKALGGPIPSLDPGYEDLTNLYPYDQNKAKSLMAEAGYSTASTYADLRQHLRHRARRPAALPAQAPRHRPEGECGGVLHVAAGCVHQPHLRYFAGGPQRKPRLRIVDRSDILFRLRQQECDQAVQRGCCRHLRQGARCQVRRGRQACLRGCAGRLAVQLPHHHRHGQGR